MRFLEFYHIKIILIFNRQAEPLTSEVPLSVLDVSAHVPRFRCQIELKLGRTRDTAAHTKCTILE